MSSTPITRFRKIGLSLIELVVVTSIISFSVVFFFSLLAQNQKLARFSRDYSLATQAASNELQFYLTLPYDEIKAGNKKPFNTSKILLDKLPSGNGYTNIKIKENGQIKEISIKIKWGDKVRRGEREIEIATNVSEETKE